MTEATIGIHNPKNIPGEVILNEPVASLSIRFRAKVLLYSCIKLNEYWPIGCSMYNNITMLNVQ